MKPKNVTEELLLFFFTHLSLSEGLCEKRKGLYKAGYDTQKVFITSRSVVEDRIKRGWDPEAIKQRLIDCKELKIKTYSVASLIPVRPPLGTKEDENILDPAEKYRHSQLRICTPPMWDEEGNLITTGSIVRVSTFTFSQLVEYFISNLNPKGTRPEVTRVLKYILNNSGNLDDILRGIDLWKHESQGKIDGEDPWQLYKVWMKQAEEEREDLNRG